VKILASFLLGIVVLVTAFAGLILSICAVGGGISMGDRMSYAVMDLIDIAIMVGAFLLILRLNRTPNP
jgi:hypothetical protein